MRPVDKAYEILKNIKGWKLKSLDEQGKICVTAGEYIDEDPTFEDTLRKMVEWYNENF